MKLQWMEQGWEDYLFWQKEDKKTLNRINRLVKEILRTPFSGTGKPEPLKGNLQGLWSRRIDDKNRVVYAAEKETETVFACRGHYK